MNWYSSFAIRTRRLFPFAALAALWLPGIVSAQSAPTDTLYAQAQPRSQADASASDVGETEGDLRRQVEALEARLDGLESPAPSIGLSGYIKTEGTYDTRQVLQVREGHLHLYPLPDAPDAETDNLLLNAFQSRLTVTGAGTEAFGAALTGVLEADFFGLSNQDVNGLRLRHAFLKLDWGQHELLAGQYWSPLFSPSVVAAVPSGSGGAPFQPIARLMQVRYTWRPGALSIVAAASQQRDAFSDIGGSKQQQQAGLPGAHLHGEYAFGGGSVGVGAYYKALRPEPLGDRFSAWAAQAYASAPLGPVTAKAKVTYGTDMTDHLMTGGFVRTEGGGYETLAAAAGWVDLSTTRSGLTAGLFAGYLTNLGANSDVVVADEFVRAADMNHLWRLAPRLVYDTGRLRLAAELEVTSALYASESDARFRPQAQAGDPAVANVRSLVSAFYFF